MKRLMITVLLLLAGLSAGVYLFSVQIVSSAAAWFATGHGIAIHEFELRRPGLKRLRIERLHTTIGTYDLNATGIDLRYEFAVFASPQLSSIQIEQLEVVMDAAAAETVRPSPSTPPQASGAFDTAMLFGLAPEISVNRLALQTMAPAFSGEGRLTLNDERGHFELVGLQPDFAQNLKAEALVFRDGRVEMTLFDTNQDATPFISISTVQDPQQVSAQGQIDLDGYPLALVSRLLDLPPGAGHVRGRLSTRFADLQALTAYSDLPITGDFEIDWQDETLRLSGVAGNFTGSISDLNIAFSGGTLHVLPADVSFTLHCGTRVQYAGQRISVGPGVTAALHNREDLDFQATFMNAEIELNDNSISLVSVATADLSAFDLTTHANIEAEANMEGQLVKAALDINTGGVKLPLNLTYDIARGRGSFSSSGQIAGKDLFGRMFTDWRYPVEISSGNIGLQLDGQWQETATATVDLQLDKTDLMLDQYSVQNVSGRLDFAIDDTGPVLHASPMQVGKIDLGVPIQDLALSLSWRGDVVDISNTRFNMLGGHVTAEPFHYRIDAGDADIEFRIEDVDLAEVLALEGDDIKGTGQLSGTLPVRVDGNALSMSNGLLRASDKGGRIELSPSFTVGTGQPGIDFAVKALNDFTYTSLAATADYAPDGDLQLAVSLQGRNPGVEKGRPIHYNLTINENLFALMEALEAQSGITQDIERRVRNRQKN